MKDTSVPDEPLRALQAVLSQEQDTQTLMPKIEPFTNIFFIDTI